MPLYSEKLQNSIIRNIQIAFKIAPGTVLAKVTHPTIETNIYRDKDIVYNPNDTVELKMYIALEPPAKVVKTLGWWKDGDIIPILCYLPYTSFYTPEMDDRIVVDSEEGYLSGTYKITATKMYGLDQPLCWVVSLVPERVVKEFESKL